MLYYRHTSFKFKNVHCSRRALNWMHRCRTETSASLFSKVGIAEHPYRQVQHRTGQLDAIGDGDNAVVIQIGDFLRHPPTTNDAHPLGPRGEKSEDTDANAHESEAVDLWVRAVHVAPRPIQEEANDQEIADDYDRGGEYVDEEAKEMSQQFQADRIVGNIFWLEAGWACDFESKESVDIEKE